MVHTPAEQRADTSFDTEPVKDKTDDGVSLAEVAVGLAAAFAGGMYVNRRKERAKAKKLESKKRTPVADNPPPTDSTPTPDPTPNMPQDPPTTEQVQDTVNADITSRSISLPTMPRLSQRILKYRHNRPPQRWQSIVRCG